MHSFVGRTALVTGASDGIGIAICRSLVKQGMTVVGCDKNVSRVKELMMELHQYPRKLHAWRCDMSIESDILAMYDYIRTKLFGVSVAVNNGIYCMDSPLITGNSDDWRYMLKAGVEGTSVSSREAIRLMEERNIYDGQIIQVGRIMRSRTSLSRNHMLETPIKSYNFYSGIRSMNRTLAQGLRQELSAKRSGIRVTTISIGSAESLPLSFNGGADFCAFLHPNIIVAAVNHILQARRLVNVNDVIIESEY